METYILSACSAALLSEVFIAGMVVDGQIDLVLQVLRVVGKQAQRCEVHGDYRVKAAVILEIEVIGDIRAHPHGYGSAALCISGASCGDLGGKGFELRLYLIRPCRVIREVGYEQLLSRFGRRAEHMLVMLPYCLYQWKCAVWCSIEHSLFGLYSLFS